VWRSEQGRVSAPAHAPAGPLPVGSLQKPFVARAWAETHPDRVPPRLACTPASRCWLPSGHGTSDLVRALALSCNAWFVQLARDTPPADLERVLRAEGFELATTPTAEAAIGLPDGPPTAIAPAALLEAYARLITRPWPAGEDTRRLVLQGLRESARRGTAQGLARRGLLAKTGTVPALDGRPLATSGWVLAFDDAGRGLLALLPHGTGREAARAAAALFARAPTAVSAPHDAATSASVRVRLLELLSPARVELRNLGDAPVRLVQPQAAETWLGPGAQRTLIPGTRLGDGLFELRAPEFGFVRRLRAALAADAAPGRGLRLTAEVALDEYVSGVVAAEAPGAGAALREELAAVVLRFLADGPRHAPDADVCDATHCAVFGGRGPRLLWPQPRRARIDPSAPPFEGLDAGAWARARARAREPGPRHFSAHCGGAPLSERYVWGRGESRATSCARHLPGSGPAWRRVWPRQALARAFGSAPLGLRVEDVDGVWHLRVERGAASEILSFDTAHRRLAAVLGWDALPSPASRVVARGAGFEAQGVGSGHRVGLCLGQGDPGGS
jgi:hypothetical protein